MQYITVANVEVPISEGPIGVSCSGGADSSLLLYLLMKNVTETIHIFTFAKNVNFRSAAVMATRAIEKCVQLTGNINIVHHTVYEQEQPIERLFVYPDSFFSENKIKCIYTGITANPSKDISDSFVGDELNTEHSTRDPLVKKDVYNFHHIRPFCNIDKQKIHEMYLELGIMDSLFPYTYSCEKVVGPEYYSHCGDCWWCKERKWGFGKL